LIKTGVKIVKLKFKLLLSTIVERIAKFSHCL